MFLVKKMHGLKMNWKEIIQDKEKIKHIFIVLFVFALFFGMQIRFLNDGIFDTDEVEIMVAGESIANGLNLYGEFFSQHMPFSYYLSALFWKLGATSIVKQRIAFYLFYAFAWTVIFERYKKIVSAKALLLYPLIFSCIITFYEYGTTVLSEHLAGIGFVILLLEYWEFCNNPKHEVKWHNCLFISLSIVLTFGTIFIAAFGIFVIAIGVLLEELKIKKSQNMSFSVFIKYLLKKYIMLVVFCGIPWLLLALYYVAKNCFKMFIFWAYIMNRTIYPLYNGGFGEGIIGSVLKSIDYNASFITQLFTVENWHYELFAELIVFVLAIVFLIMYSEKKGLARGLVLICFVLSICTRGIFNFHATQWVEVLSLFSAILICKFVSNNKCFRLYGVLLIVLLSSGYLKNFSGITTISFQSEKSEISKVVEAVTDEREAVWTLTLTTNYILVEANRPLLKNVGAVPWFWDAYGKQTIEQWNGNPPRVALFNGNNEVWGYNINDYGKELIEYMNKYYIQYNDSFVYLRKDYYDEAIKKIENQNGL